MADRPAPEPRAKGLLAFGVLSASAGLALFALYVFAAFELPGEADITAHSSGLFDMDVSRVVSDLATARPSYRASVHPLQKLLVSPIGRAIDALLWKGRNPLGAARVLVLLCITLQALAAGALAWQWTRGSRSAAFAAFVPCGLSFASWLAASVPESAAVASLAAVAPLLLSNARWRRPFTTGEALVWGALGALAFGLTVTQLIFWALALGLRATLGREPLRPDAAADAAPQRLAPALAVGAALLLATVGLQLQASWYPPATQTDAGSPLATELHFLRTAELGAAPVAHVGTVLAHFAVIDFAAPFPGRSEFLIRDYGLDYWSLSVEEAGADDWALAQRALAFAVALWVAIGCFGLRRADARMLAALLGVGAQFALHVFYGREYVLYAPHWHAAWVALLTVGVWNALPRRSGTLLLIALSLAAALAVNDVAVMRVAYAELEAGLGTALRDANGALLLRD
jgi:hypothetical protein